MKVILDTDLGIDDAVALAYAVGNPNIELLAVTGTYGNVYVEQGVSNASALLGLLGAPEVVVSGGLAHALGCESFNRLKVSARIHGEDGLGNLAAKYGLDVATREPVATGGVDLIIEACLQVDSKKLERELDDCLAVLFERL